MHTTFNEVQFFRHPFPGILTTYRTIREYGKEPHFFREDLLLLNWQGHLFKLYKIYSRIKTVSFVSFEQIIRTVKQKLKIIAWMRKVVGILWSNHCVNKTWVIRGLFYQNFLINKPGLFLTYSRFITGLLFWVIFSSRSH